MTVKTTVSSKDIDEAFLQLKDIVKETPLTKRSLSLS
jgi:threonine dehydratase